MLALISFTILFSYTAYYLSRVGLLPSHSDSYTDYKVLRAYETGVPLNAELIQLRANARAEINRLEGEIEEMSALPPGEE